MKNIFIYISTTLTLIATLGAPTFATEREQGLALPPLMFSAVNAGYKDPDGN